jgi:hypothetical protein
MVTEEKSTGAEYQIVCVKHAQSGHIESVGASLHGGGEGYDEIWTVEDVRRLMELDHRFYTVSPSTGSEADVQRYEASIRSNRIK